MNWMHEMADDCATWAVEHWSTCTQNCNQGRSCTCVDQRQGAHKVDTKQPMPAESCTEVGAEPRKERMGSFRGWERNVVVYGPVCLALFGCLSGFLFGIWTAGNV